jgi:serine/threonine protein kinase
VRQDEGFPLVEYHLIKRIGEGNFGDVWLADKEGEAVALKILKGSANSEDTRREIKSLEALEGLDHPFLLQTRGYWIDTDRLVIEMELSAGGSLKERLKQCKQADLPGIPAGELLKYFREAAEALDYLHSRTGQRIPELGAKASDVTMDHEATMLFKERLLHRDIKPGNILLVDGCAKLADFGLLRQVAGDKSHTHTTGGTQPYMAPESIVRNETSPRSDLFAFAVSYIQLRQGRLPFYDELQFNIMKKITESDPELSDIIGPGEKDVLLKALAKDPNHRQQSCGQFVDELIAAIPPADRVFTPYHAPAISTSELDATDATAAGTVKRGSSRKQPRQSREAGSSIKPRAKPETTKPAAMSDAATVPRRRKSGKKRLVGFAFLAIGLIALIGLWFHLHESTKDDIRQLMKKGDFAKAVETIEDTGPLLLPQTSELMGEIERDWWKKLDPQGVQNKGALKTLQDELVLFTKAFPRHAEIEGRSKAIAVALATPLSPSALAMNEIDSLLKDDNLLDAKAMFIAKKADLSPADQETINVKISHKQAVHGVLKRARKHITIHHFDEALAEFDLAKPHFDFPQDKTAWDQLFAEAKKGEHTRLVAAADNALKKGTAGALEEAAESLAKFRMKYPDRGWLPSLEKYRTIATVDRVIERAWVAIAASNIQKCQEEIAEIERKFPSDPTGKGNVRVLTALIKAHQAADGNDRTIAANDLVKVVEAEGRDLKDLAPNVWKALVALEQKNGLFSFDDANQLVQAIPSSGSTASPRSTLIAAVLDRLVQQKGSWRPGDKQWDQCRKLCEMIDPLDQTAWIHALHVESWVEGPPGKPAPAAVKHLDKATIWYAAYAGALARQKTDLQDAADLILKVLDRDAKAIAPAVRLSKSVDVLRRAAKSLFQESKHKKEFKNGADAARAKTLLFQVVSLESSNQRLLADLMDLAIAAGGAKDAETLKDAADRVGKLIAGSEFGDEDKEQVFFWLARSYRSCAPDGKHADKVFSYCDEALKVNLKGKSDWRRLAAQEGADYALALGNERLEEGKSWDSAILMSQKAKSYAIQLRPLALEIAADRNRDAYVLLLSATWAKHPNEEAKEVKQAFLSEAPEKLDAYDIPTVIHKLTFLQKVSYFESKNQYLADSRKNPYFEKTMAEARLAHAIKNPAAGSEGEWWKKTRKDLLNGMFDCLIEYAYKGFKIANGNQDEDWSTKHVPKLKAVLGHYLEARDLKLALSMDKKGLLSLQVGYTYVNLGHAYNSNQAEDGAKAIEHYRIGRQELKEIPTLFRNRMPAKHLQYLNQVEAALELVLKNAKGK